MLDHLSRAARIGDKILRAVAIALALLMLSFSGYSMLDSFYLEKMAFSSWDLVQHRPVAEDGRLSGERFEELRAINEDVVGWITIYGTNIDYPILQGPDNLYYVNRDIYGESSLSGSIYLQSENKADFSDSFNLLYGHHFENGAMFGDVSKYKDPDYMMGHRNGELITKDGIFYLRVFACIETDAYDSSIYGVTDVADTSAQSLNKPHKLVHYPPDATTDGDIIDDSGSFVILGHENVLALSTCDDAETDGRDVVVADVEPGNISRVESTEKSNKTNNVPKTGEISPSAGKWAFLNLVSMIFTVFCIVPFVVRIFARKDKNYERDRKAGLPIGLVMTLVTAVAAILLFVFTENMRCPVTLRDRWTPFMLILFALALLLTSFAERHKHRDDDPGRPEIEIK